LPPAARGSDEEVGAFVLTLFGEQRRRSQATLAEALERADKHQLSVKCGHRLPEGTLSGVSGVSALSTVGVAASLAPPKLSSADIDATFAGRDGRRFVKVAVVAGVCAALVLALVLFAQGSSKQVEPAAAKPAPSAAAVAAHAEPPPPAVNLDALPVESVAEPAPSADASAELAPRRSGARGKAPSPARIPVAPASAAAPAKSASAAVPVKPTWKHDPGF
jgi:hypothetical protein